MTDTALAPMHPGEFLREEILPNIDISVTALAGRLGISRQTLHAVLREEAGVTPNLALRLARLLGTSPQVWTNLQASYDLAMLGTTMAEELDRIAPMTMA
jgi:addiction module HigA family antidote